MSAVRLPDGKHVVVSGDLGIVRLQLNAFRGILGVQLTPEEAHELIALLIVAARKAKKG